MVMILMTLQLALPLLRLQVDFCSASLRIIDGNGVASDYAKHATN